MIEHHAYSDGDEELLPRCVRAALLESLGGGQTPRHVNASPADAGEPEDEEETAVADNNEDDPPPDDDEEDIGGPAPTGQQKVYIKKIRNNCCHPSSELLRCLRLSGVQGIVLTYVRRQFNCG